MKLFTDYLSPIESVPSGKYAMWLPTAEEPHFTSSETRKHIMRVYTALDGYETYVFARLLTDFKIDPQGESRVGLPDQLFPFYLRGPQDKFVVFSASEEKGLRFHLPSQKTSSQYLVTFWRLYAEYVEIWRRGLDKNPSVVAPTSNGDSIQWWRLCDEAAVSNERNGSPVQVVGAIVI